MEMYLGICMIIITIALCIGVLSNVVLDAIYKKNEAHKKRLSNNRWAAAGKFIMWFNKYYGEEIRNMLEVAKMKNTKETMEKMDDFCNDGKHKTAYEKAVEEFEEDMKNV